MRDDSKELVTRYQKTEDDLSALQSVGQIIGDVLKRLDSERFIVKASSGPRYVVGCRSRLNHEKLKPGTRVALDMTTLTIMRVLPREVDPTVFHMQSSEEDGGVKYSDIGGLNEQIRELREVIELPLTNPELFVRVGIKVSNSHEERSNEERSDERVRLSTPERYRRLSIIRAEFLRFLNTICQCWHDSL